MSKDLVVVIGFDPVSSRAAWAVTAPRAAPDSGRRGIERTVTAGHTWKVVTPATSKGLGGFAFVDGDFLDTNDAWVAAMSSGPAPKTELLRTTDGGGTWQDLGRLPAPCYSSPRSLEKTPQVQFVDRDHGWCGVESLHGDQPTAIYRTVDGGRHWTALDGPRSITRILANQATSPPVWQAEFTSPTNGWANTACPHGVSGYLACLWRSDDGGATWQLQHLPSPPHSAGRVNLAGLPAGRADDLAEAAYVGVGDGATDIYRSTDGGRSWRLIRPPGPPTVWQPSLIDGLHWKLILGRRILTTHNAGRGWRSVRADRTLTLTDDPHAVPSQTVFSTPNTGWFIVGVEARSVWRSTNGGATWEPVALPDSQSPAIANLRT